MKACTACHEVHAHLASFTLVNGVHIRLCPPCHAHFLTMSHLFQPEVLAIAWAHRPAPQ